MHACICRDEIPGCDVGMSGTSTESHPLLLPHGRQWCKLETLSIDPSIGQRYHSNARFHWPNLVDQHQKTNADYFMLFYPMRGLSNMLMFTNLNMARKNLPPLGKGEFIKYLGLRLAMTCEPKRGPIPVYWQVGDEPGSVYTGADFGGRFGMTRHRFQDITNCFSFTVPRDGVGADDVSGTYILYQCVSIFTINFFSGPMARYSAFH